MAINSIFDIAGSGMRAQSVRLNTTASNLANAETASSSVDETYRARKPVFAAIQEQAFMDAFDKSIDNAASSGVQVQGIVEKQGPLQQRYEPYHPMANDEGYVSYPNVNVVEEMADMMAASRGFQINTQVMETAKTMLQQVLTLGQ